MKIEASATIGIILAITSGSWSASAILGAVYFFWTASPYSGPQTAVKWDPNKYDGSSFGEALVIVEREIVPRIMPRAEIDRNLLNESDLQDDSRYIPNEKDRITHSPKIHAKRFEDKPQIDDFETYLEEQNTKIYRLPEDEADIFD